jgi:methyl-accepting chemotaxis protein
MISSAAESMRSMTELIRDATVTETQHSASIVEAIEKLRLASQSGLEAVAELDDMVRRVNDSTGQLNTHLKRFKI